MLIPNVFHEVQPRRGVDAIKFDESNMVLSKGNKGRGIQSGSVIYFRLGWIPTIPIKNP